MARAARLRLSTTGMMVIVLVVVLVGVGSTVLVGPAPLINQHVSAEANVTLSAPLWGALFFGPLLVGLVAYVVRWVLMTRMHLAIRVSVSVLLALGVVALLSAAILQESWDHNSVLSIGANANGGADGNSTANGTGSHHGSTGGGGNNSTTTGGGGGGGGKGGGKGGSGGTGNNTTGKKGNGTGNTTGNGSSNGTGNGSTGPGHSHGSGNNSSRGVSGARSTGGVRVSISNWVFLGIAAFLSVTVALLSIPGVISRMLDRPRGGGGGSLPGAGAVRLAFRDARVAIEAGESPRETIVRLYGRLLDGIGPGVHGLESATPAEIERSVLSRLRVTPERSQMVTRMFEEACYSNHVLGDVDAQRYVQTMQAVEHDLISGGTPG